MLRYLKLDEKSLFNYTVMYFDDYIDTEYTADAIFQQNGLKVKFFKDFKSVDNKKLHIHIVKIKKRDLPKFESCMEKLANKMLILGYRNYEKEVNDTIKKFLNDVEVMGK